MNKLLIIGSIFASLLIIFIVYSHYKNEEIMNEDNLLTNKKTESLLLDKPSANSNKNKKLITEQKDNQITPDDKIVQGDEQPLLQQDDEIPLSKTESSIALKFSGTRGSSIKVDDVKKIKSIEDFGALLDNLSYENTQKGVENRYIYEDIFNQAFYDDNQFTLERLECGIAVCMSSIRYSELENTKRIINRLNSVEGFDSKAIMFFGKGIKTFDAQNSIGIVFTTGESNGELLISRPIGPR